MSAVRAIARHLEFQRLGFIAERTDATRGDVVRQQGNAAAHGLDVDRGIAPVHLQPRHAEGVPILAERGRGSADSAAVPRENRGRTNSLWGLMMMEGNLRSENLRSLNMCQPKPAASNGPATTLRMCLSHVAGEALSSPCSRLPYSYGMTNLARNSSDNIGVAVSGAR